MVPNGAERRKYARLDLALTVSYRVLGQTGIQSADPREAVSSDVSIGGLRLMTPTALANGTMLELEILLGEEPDPVKANRVMQAMLKMKKIDIAALERAAGQP